MQYHLGVVMAVVGMTYAMPNPNALPITARAVSSVAASAATSVVACATSTYNTNVPSATTFTDASCQISKQLTPGQPLSCAFPAADQIGLILGPMLQAAIGNDVINDIDVVAEDLCISAEEDQADGNGLCDNTLQLVRDLAASQDQDAVNTYNCLLNLLCVARASPKHTGTCQYLLSGADCVANRILRVPGSPECEGTGAKI